MHTVKKLSKAVHLALCTSLASHTCRSIAPTFCSWLRTFLSSISAYSTSSNLQHQKRQPQSSNPPIDIRRRSGGCWHSTGCNGDRNKVAQSQQSAIDLKLGIACVHVIAAIFSGSLLVSNFSAPAAGRQVGCSAILLFPGGPDVHNVSVVLGGYCVQGSCRVDLPGIAPQRSKEALQEWGPLQHTPFMSATRNAVPGQLHGSQPSPPPPPPPPPPP